MLIQADNLLAAWKQLNWNFINMKSHEGQFIPNRDFTRVAPFVTMVAHHGFGFTHEDIPGFFASPNQRINRLAKRYIDPDLWEEGVARIAKKRPAKSSPMAYTIQFHRKATGERKVPSGGGCLQAVTLVWINGVWQLHVFLRASEITAALIGDLLFVKYVVEKIDYEVGLKGYDPDTIKITWEICLASQMKAIIGLFILFTGDDTAVKSFMQSESATPWQEGIKQHFWNEFLFPDEITWGARRRWSKKFYDHSKTPNKWMRRATNRRNVHADIPEL